MAQPIDVEQLMTRCMGQLDFAQEILTDFLDTCESGLDSIRESGTRSDIEALRTTAHRLKGTSATVAATNLSEMFEQMEQHAAAGDVDSIRNQFGPLDEEFGSVKQFVTNLCQQESL